MKSISIDIGGSAIKAALVLSDGTFEQCQTIPTPNEDQSLLLQNLTQLINEYKEHGEIEKIGFSVPGAVSESGAVSFGGAVPALAGVNLKTHFEQYYQMPVYVRNDAKAAAVGEKCKGSLQDVSNGVALILGTGVGVGLLLDGKVRKGPHSQAGEVSFLIQDRYITGKESFVGMNLSAVHLVTQLALAMDLSTTQGSEVFETLFQQEAAKATQIFQQYCKSVALLCFNLQCLLDLEKIVIGGGISQQMRLIEGINLAYERILETSPMIQRTIPKIPIVAAKFKASANLIGAVEGEQYE